MGIAETRETVRACKHCFMCRYISPHFIATKLESCTPKGYGILLSEIDEGKREWTDTIADYFYQCTLGGECREDCFFDWKEDQMVRDARDEIVKKNLVPASVKTAAENLIEKGNIYGEKKYKLASKYADKGNSRVLFIPGNTLGEMDQEAVDKAVLILKKEGSDFSIFDRDISSGMELYDLGYYEAAKSSALKFAGALKESNAGVIVSYCAASLRAIKELFPEWGITLPEGLQVIHFSEFVEKAAKENKLALKKNIGKKTAYHDGSYLGRKLGVFDAPRDVIGMCVSGSLSELYFNREKAQSSGAGSAMFFTHPEIGCEIAKKVLEEAENDGVELLVTSSQNSVKTFKNAKEKFNSSVEIKSIIDVVFDSL